MKLKADQIEKVAKLANLKINPSQSEVYSDQLSEILDYIDQLNKADSKNVEPLFNVSGGNTVEREDQVGESLTSEEALSNASAKKEDFFVTKGVFSDE